VELAGKTALLTGATGGLGQAIARALADEFRGTVGASPKLHGRRKGKDLYRVTYLVRIADSA